MARVTTTRFDDLVKLAGEFVTSRKGMWDHAAWLDFIADVQKLGFNVSEEMQSRLGELLEAVKRFYEASASVEGIDKAMTTILKDSEEFIWQQRGIWGHAEWEAFAQQVQKNTLTLTQETTAYLGGILEATRAFYAMSPAPAAPKKAKKRPVGKVADKPVSGQVEAKDDLTAISGIGPALVKKLNGQGIYSYAQIAALSKKDIERLEKTVIKFSGRIKRDDWVGQAKKLSRQKGAS
jgi:predicted flap endonuclease-1-like 5' DNA nuclease